MSEWQDIETAPTDGTPVILFASVRGWEDCGYTRCVGYYNDRSWTAYGPAFGEPVKRVSGKRQRSPQNVTECQPTLWQPLPELP